MNRRQFTFLFAGMMSLTLAFGAFAQARDGSKSSPLRVMLIPADTGADTTRDDFQPLFNAITKQYGINFELRVGSSYAAVVEGMANGVVDIAFFGAVTLKQAQDRGAAELLAVSVSKGSSSYYSGLFCRADSGIRSVSALNGKKMSFGDMNSTSSFNYPVAMLLSEGVDPVQDLGAIYITGSHSNSIAALKEGLVDVCACSFNAYEKAVKNGVIDPKEIIPLAKSDPIPNPPLAMHPSLSKELKGKLKMAFDNIHTAPGIKPEMLRGYGGKRVDRYDANYPQVEFDKAISKLSKVTNELKAEMLEKSTK